MIVGSFCISLFRKHNGSKDGDVPFSWEDGRVWDAKLKVSLQRHLVGLFVAIDSHCYVCTRVRKCGCLLSLRKTVPTLYCLMVRRVGDKNTG